MNAILDFFGFGGNSTTVPGASGGTFNIGGGPQILPDNNLMGALNSIVNWLFTVLLIVAVIFILIAAFNFITAAGDPEKVKTARQFVIYALIGVVVALLARGLITFVQNVI